MTITTLISRFIHLRPCVESFRQVYWLDRLRGGGVSTVCVLEGVKVLLLGLVSMRCCVVLTHRKFSQSTLMRDKKMLNCGELRYRGLEGRRFLYRSIASSASDFLLVMWRRLSLLLRGGSRYMIHSPRSSLSRIFLFLTHLLFPPIPDIVLLRLHYTDIWPCR